MDPSKTLKVGVIGTGWVAGRVFQFFSLRRIMAADRSRRTNGQGSFVMGSIVSSS